MIRLEIFSDSHFNKLISWMESAEDLMQFAGPSYTFPLTDDQLYNSLNDENRYSFSVIYLEEVIGHCEIYLKEKTIHLGRILIGDKNLRGKGIGTEIVNQLLNFGFNKFDKSYAELNVFDWNISAIACYKKIGFNINDGKRMERKINNQTWLALNMILDKEEWAKNRFEK